MPDRPDRPRLLLWADTPRLRRPGHAGLDPTKVETEQLDETKMARVGEDRVILNTGTGISSGGIESDARGALFVGGRRYDITTSGLVRAT